MSRLRRGDFLIPFLTVICDVVAIEIAFLLSYWIRFHTSFFTSLGYLEENAPPLGGYLGGSLFIIPVWLMLFNARQMYGSRRNVSMADESLNIVKVVSLGMLVVMSAAFFYRDFSYSRIVFGLLWVTAMISLMIGRGNVRAVERRLYRKRAHLQRSIIVGADDNASTIYARLQGHGSFGIAIEGYFADAVAPPASPLASAPHLGTIAEAARYIQDRRVELVFIALGPENRAALFTLVSECEGINVQFMMVPDVLGVLTSQVKVKELEGIPFLEIKSIPLTAWGRILKRTMDIVVAGALLLLLSPFWVLIMILIRLESRGPLFYVQERVGLDGRSFRMYKFRSMRVDAERVSGPVWTQEHDERRTRVGVFLRKTSLDEIPQLYNVLKAEMSLVGPRPERPYFVEQFKELVPKYLDRHRVKAGMTGWAQVNGLRGDTSLEERIKYDLYYIENWSLTFDIRIMLRTLHAALKVREVH
jgi:Undecaprenyl-phosphate glucose phosphotransferase